MMGDIRLLGLFAAVWCVCAAPTWGCDSLSPNELRVKWQESVRAHYGVYGLGLDFVQPFQELLQRSGQMAPPSNCDSLCNADSEHCMHCTVEAYMKQQGYDKCMAPDPTSDDLHARSICPWTYVVTTSAVSYPSTMVEAQCSCQNCSHVANPGLSSCQKVTYALPVLMKTDQVDPSNNNFCLYETKVRKMSVGCTCVKNRVAS